MTRFTKDEMKNLCDELLATAEKLEEIGVASHNTSRTTRSAYAILNKDFLWKVTRLREVVYYLCGVKNMNPFDDLSGAT